MTIFQRTCGNELDDISGLDFNGLITKIKNNDFTIINLDVRALEPEEFIELFRALKDNNIVKSLILRGNWGKCDLTNENMYLNLSNLLRHNKSIKALTLYNTNIEDDGIECIFKALQENNILTYLKLWGHKLSTNGELEIVKMLVQNKYLKEFLIDSLSNTTKLIILSQHEYINPIDFKFNIHDEVFCTSVNHYDGGNGTHESRVTQMNNPIEYSVEQKKLALDKIINLLENKNFSKNFIKITRNFYNEKFITIEKMLAEKYALLNKELNNNGIKQGKEIKVQYEEKKASLIAEYDNLQ